MTFAQLSSLLFGRHSSHEPQPSDQRDARAARESHQMNARLLGEDAWRARVVQACAKLGCDDELFARWKHPTDQAIRSQAQSEMYLLFTAQQRATEQAHQAIRTQVASRLAQMAAAHLPTPAGIEAQLWDEEEARHARAAAACRDEATLERAQAERRRLGRMYQSRDAATRLAAAVEVTQQEQQYILALG